MSKYLPSEEQFRKDISEIYIDENLDYSWALKRLKYHLNDAEPENDPFLTYQKVLGKYRYHIENWNLRNAEKERRGYLDRDQSRKRKNIVEFLEARMYLLEWTTFDSNPLRDNYLFGTLVNKENLLMQLKDFKKSCLKNNPKD